MYVNVSYGARMGSIPRRRILAGGAAIITAASVTGTLNTEARAATDDARRRRVDVHHHFTPPLWLDWAEQQGLIDRGTLPWWTRWDLDSALSMMDTAGIETAVVTVATPASRYVSPEQQKESLVVAFQAMTELVAARPGRFAFFAPLPLDNRELAAWSAGYGRAAGAAGMSVMTHDPQGRYLGDTVFDELFTELNAQPTVLNVHPTELPGVSPTAPAVPGVPSFLCDYPLDTTRAAINMIVHSTLDRFPNLSVILPHGGGFLPYIATRAEYGSGFLTPSLDPARIRNYLHRFHYDTAAPMSPGSTPTLLATVDPARILFATDWPATPSDLVTRAASGLDVDPALTITQRTGINRRNALRLFPQLPA